MNKSEMQGPQHGWDVVARWDGYPPEVVEEGWDTKAQALSSALGRNAEDLSEHVYYTIAPSRVERAA